MSTTVTERLQQQKEHAKALRELWQELFNQQAPTPTQIYIWLRRYPVEVVEEGIRCCAMKAYRLAAEQNEMSADHQLRYASAVMRNLQQEKKHKEEGPSRMGFAPHPK